MHLLGMPLCGHDPPVVQNGSFGNRRLTSEPSHRGSPATGELEHGRIVRVDDRPVADRLVFEDSLFRGDVRRHVRVAIEMIRRKAPDLVVLDLALSPGNGLNVLRNLRAEGRKCKVLVLTHQPLDVYRMQCEALGADGFHDKATDIHLIVELVRGWVAEAPVEYIEPKPAPVVPLMPVMAYRDAVTALPNRPALLEKLDLALRIARRDGHGLAVFVVALEELSYVRKKLGVERSDDVLAQAGARLAGAFPRGDVVARMAEDGFSVVVTRVTSEDGANHIGEQIAELMKPEFVCGQRLLPMSSGVGMAMFPHHGHTAQALLS